MCLFISASKIKKSEKQEQQEANLWAVVCQTSSGQEVRELVPVAWQPGKNNGAYF